jgi:hypothetical protein
MESDMRERDDTAIGNMSFDGMDAEQLTVVLRLALNAESEYDQAGRVGLANQCMTLRNRAREVIQFLNEANDLEEAAQ